MIDIHHHLLYGLDDGPSKSETMRQMLQAAVDEGVHTIVATPHISPGIDPFSRDTIRARVEEAQKLSDEMALNICVLEGAEILFSPQTARFLAEDRIPTLAGTNKVLIEFSENVRFETIEEAVQTVLRNASIPVIAHIERYKNLISPVRRAISLKKNNQVYFQINCDTILKNNGKKIPRSIRKLLARKMIDYVASDAHDCDKRRCRMKDAHENLITMVGQEYADQLTGKHSTITDFIGQLKNPWLMRRAAK